MTKSNKYDIAFEDYRGRRRYTVSHPDFTGVLMVAAPDDVAAIVAAAELWQTRWQSFGFYAFCDVRRCETNKEEDLTNDRKNRTI